MLQSINKFSITVFLELAVLLIDLKVVHESRNYIDYFFDSGVIKVSDGDLF